MPALGLTTDKGNGTRSLPAGSLALGWIHSMALLVTECLHTIFVQLVGHMSNGEKQHLNGGKAPAHGNSSAKCLTNLPAD